MSTDLTPKECLTGKVHVCKYFGGRDRGECVQLTFSRPDDLHGERHAQYSNAMGTWYMNMDKDQANELGHLLLKFANDVLEQEDYD